jgi:hypothetical protein
MRGVLAAFQELDAAVLAVREAKRQRLGEVTVYTPTPRHELEEVIAAGPSAVRRFTLIGGLLGVTFGYWIAIWASDWWPLVVFANARLPKLTMAVGYDPRFSHGDYGIWVECPPDKVAATEAMLRQFGAVEVRDVR